MKFLEERTMNENTITTGKARLSYEHLFTPHTQPGGKPEEAKYSVTVLVPKSDIATKQRIDAAIAVAKQAGVTSKWKGVMPPLVTIPLYDGDGVRPNGERFGDECKGHWVFTASCKQQPQVVDLGMNPIINPSEVYSGCYARVNVSFFPYDSNGKRGIGCGLNCAQKLEDGEPLGSKVSVEEAFGAPAAAPQQYAQPAYQQPAYQQPVQAAPPYATIDPLTGMPYAVQ
jgi:hypothetical protein